MSNRLSDFSNHAYFYALAFVQHMWIDLCIHASSVRRKNISKTGTKLWSLCSIGLLHSSYANVKTLKNMSFIYKADKLMKACLALIFCQLSAAGFDSNTFSLSYSTPDFLLWRLSNGQVVNQKLDVSDLSRLHI